MALLKHITDLISERDALQAEVDTLRAELSSKFGRITVRAESVEEMAAFCNALGAPVSVQLISADVAEENKRLAAELAKAEARVKTLQTNLLGIAGLGVVYANEED